jgi:hypothetical protein
MNDPDFIAFSNAIDNKEAIEGSMYADDLERAQMVREFAEQHEISEITQLPKHDIAKKVRAVIAHRYKGQSRKDRRRLLASN